MSHSTHAWRPLMAATLLVGLCLTGNAAFADTGKPTPSTPTIQTQAGGQQWAIDPSHGPAAGKTAITLTPPATSTPDHFTQASAGFDYSLAINLDGNLYSWGVNDFGQLGRDTGSTNQDGKPSKVNKPAGVDKWTQISAGYNHSLALGSDGNLYTWGRNDYGQLGRDTGSANQDATPSKVDKPAGVDKWTQISARDSNSLALGSDGNLYTWGRNDFGQLGRDTGRANQDGKPGMVTKPAGVDKWTQASASVRYSTLAIGSDNNLYTWGRNVYGQLGRVTKASYDVNPGMVDKPAGVDTWTQISAGDYHSLALGSDGNLYTWGINTRGELGRNISGVSDEKPDKVAKLEGVDKWAQISAGGQYSAAIGSDKNIYTWGSNKYGQLGRNIGGKNFDTNLGKVIKPANVDTWTQIAPGFDHFVAIGSDGNLYTWGCDYAEELGHDTSSGNPWDTTPGRVVFPDDKVVLTGVKFGQDLGTGLTANTDGTWSVTTPEHAAGTVPVTVSWTLNGVAQPDAQLSYTYEAAPIVTHTVTFDTADGSPLTTQQVTDGDKAIKPTNPTRDGYQFDGWFKETDAYDFNQPVTKDLTLTAHWTSTANQKPTNPTKKPDKPASDPKPSDSVLSKTGSDTATILTAGLLALAAGILTLTGVRTRQRATQSPTTR